MSEFHQHAPETFELLRYAGQLGVPVVGLSPTALQWLKQGFWTTDAVQSIFVIMRSLLSDIQA